MFINFKFLPNIDAIWVLTKLARWTTISDRKLFLDFLVKSTNCDVTLADCHQNVEIFFFHFLSQTYIIWKSIRRRAKHRKPLFDTTHMSRVMGLQKYFSAPPGSIVFLKKTIALVFSVTLLHKISWFFGTKNLSLWTKIVCFYIFIFWLNNANLSSFKKMITWHFQTSQTCFPGFCAVGNFFF